MGKVMDTILYWFMQIKGLDDRYSMVLPVHFIFTEK